LSNAHAIKGSTGVEIFSLPIGARGRGMSMFFKR